MALTALLLADAWYVTRGSRTPKMAFKDKEFPIVGKKLERMCAATQDDRAAVLAAHLTWDMHDARVACFQRLFTCWNPTLIGLVLTAEHLEVDEWWASRPYRSTIPPCDRARSTRDFLNVLKIGYLHATTAVVENTLRVLLHALDPSAAKGGLAEFQSVYSALLKRLSAKPAEAAALLELWRLGRNTVHNNGAYRHERGQDRSVSYKGVTYAFRHNHKVNYYGWELLLSLGDDLRQLLREIVSDSAVAALPAPVRDEWAD
ncbi:MAG: hypothetical protein HYU88_13630 [Chloroflexi bacterium]|nr:hypothetical protein [Chloroflexota bacterium]